MDRRLMLSLLRLLDNTRTSEESFLERCGLPEEKIKHALREASRLGLVQIVDGCLQVSQAERLKLVVRCLEKGEDVEQVCKAAGWREFEDLAAMILGSDGYVTKRHLRFRFDERGYEVDVLAFKAPWSLVVECKRWKRSWQPASLRRVATSHKRKAYALVNALPKLLNSIGYTIHDCMKLVPVVLSLSETPMMIEDGVPFVPISRFQSFLEGFPGYLEDLTVFTYPPEGT